MHDCWVPLPRRPTGACRTQNPGTAGLALPLLPAAQIDAPAQTLPLPQMLEAVDECAGKAGMDAGALHECAEGQQGDELEREAAEQTDALCPPHAYVPWCGRRGDVHG